MAPKKTFDSSESSLYTKTLQMLVERPRSVLLSDIAEATNIPEAWLKAFGQGRMSDPSVVRVEILYNYLSDEPLELSHDT